MHNFTPTAATEETMHEHTWWHVHCSMEIALWIVSQQDFSPWWKVVRCLSGRWKIKVWREKITVSSWSSRPCTHRQHSHLQLMWGYLHNASGGLWQGWQVQVKIPEPVPQNYELGSKSVCKDPSAWYLVVDSVSLNPRAMIRTATWTCSIKKH